MISYETAPNVAATTEKQFEALVQAAQILIDWLITTPEFKAFQAERAQEKAEAHEPA